MSNIVPFKFGETNVRVIEDDSGAFEVVAKDVAEGLGYNWQANLIAHVPEEWKGVKPINTPGGVQQMATLKEPGLYFFLGRSDKPDALPMQKWVSGEVLPSIRKTGGYAKPATEADRTRAAFDAATQAAAFVQNAVFNAVMSGGDDWKDDRWMITFREDVAKNLLAYVHPMEVGAIAAPWPRLVKDVAGGECLRSNSDLIEMASACMQRLQRRAGQTRIAT